MEEEAETESAIDAVLEDDLGNQKRNLWLLSVKTSHCAILT